MKKKIFGILALAFILSSCSMVKNDIDFLLRQGKIRAGKASEDYAKDILGDDYFDYENEDEDMLEDEDLDEIDNDEDILEKDENGNATIKDGQDTIKKNNQFDLFADLQGKILYDCLVDSGEKIYFRKDGNFDGSCYYGDGQNMSYALFKGQFANPKKIDDNTYTVRLTKFSYQTPKSGSFEENGVTTKYVDAHNFNQGMLGEEFTFHLPASKITDLENKGYTVDLYYKPDYPDGKAGAYMLSKKHHKEYTDIKDLVFMKEYPDVKKGNIDENNSNVFELGKQFPKISNEEPTSQANAPKKTQGINDKTEVFFSHSDQICMSEMILENYKEEKKQAIGGVKDLEGSLKFLDTGSHVLYNLEQSKNFKDMFENKTLSDIDLDSKDKQPIIKVLGNIRDKKEIKPKSDTDIKITTYTLLASKRTGEKILISLDFCGDIDTATFIQEDGSELVKTWAIPMGVYKIKDKDLGEVTVYKFAAGEGTQQAAYEIYGDTYGF
ncbi:hypothetical protein NH286_03870 [Anaerococcus sp. NML200574]|uniref:hypothetical protein n=1 Tax=unclassified Anaerococcus TaxID=2614126 RepID=UPI000D0B93F9|nr:MULTISPECIES: hypothetical protein [unclassified Anaerococcus]MCW6678285.1 hypothetical protein [Anaerococcus sp. NML200574]